MSDQGQNQERDDVRLEVAIQTIKDILLRFEESSEGTRTVYEVLGFVVSDLIADGLCPACLNEAFQMAFTESGADLEIHLDDTTSTFH